MASFCAFSAPSTPPGRPRPTPSPCPGWSAASVSLARPRLPSRVSSLLCPSSQPPTSTSHGSSAIGSSPSAICPPSSAICPPSSAICPLAFAIRLLAFAICRFSFPIFHSEFRIPHSAQRLQRPQQCPRLGRLVAPVPLERRAAIQREGRKGKRGITNIDGKGTIGESTRMPRTARSIEAGMVDHVLNRGNGRLRLFHKRSNYDAFERVLVEGLKRYPVDLLTHCLMPNHWHRVVRPRTDVALRRLMGWVGVTHVRRHHEHYHRRDAGHLYQGRFKAFPTMFKSASSAPRGGTNKRGRTHPVYHPDLVPPNLDLLDQRTDDFPPFLPARPGQAGLNALGEILQTL